MRSGEPGFILTSNESTHIDWIMPLMNLIESGDCGPRNNYCWRAILDAVEEWSPESKGGALEARFDENVLTLAFNEPGKHPIIAKIDIAWIASADQTDRFGILTRMALSDIEIERLSRRDLARPTSLLPIGSIRC